MKRSLFFKCIISTSCLLSLSAFAQPLTKSMSCEMDVTHFLKVLKHVRYSTVEPGHYECNLSIHPDLKHINVSVDGKKIRITNAVLPTESGVFHSNDTNQDYNFEFHVDKRSQRSAPYTRTESCRYECGSHLDFTYMPDGTVISNTVIDYCTGSHEVTRLDETVDRSYHIDMLHEDSKRNDATISFRTHDLYSPILHQTDCR